LLIERTSFVHDFLGIDSARNTDIEQRAESAELLFDKEGQNAPDHTVASHQVAHKLGVAGGRLVQKEDVEVVEHEQ
jgi:hypothetical protein